MIYIIFLCVYYEKNHLSIPSLGLATAAALIATTSFSCWLQSLKWFFLIHLKKQVDPRFLADAENFFIVQFKADTKHLNRYKTLRFD